MIIARSPVRITLGGGGTDLPSYYRQHEGFLIAGAIDKYVYITLHRTFTDELIIKYSRMERTRSVDEIQHPVVREALKCMGLCSALELTSMADIPAGTGLGSSGSFITALLSALHCYKKQFVSARELAEQACYIEMNLLREPVGAQDQYISAFGGITCFRFRQDDEVEALPLKVDAETLHNLEDNLLLFFTGNSRSASLILAEQDNKSRAADREMTEHLHIVKQIGLESRDALEAGDLHRFAELMNVHWEHKKKRSASITNGQIDAWYELGMRNGALGGKLVGAGGGGFLMFYADERVRLRHAMREAGLREVRFRFDFEGAKVIAHS